MFRWYRNADKCYVYLSDVSYEHDDNGSDQGIWESAFRRSKWFTRGWTLQELLAPVSVEFFSRERKLLGSKRTLEGLVHHITQIPTSALRMISLSNYSVDERLGWAAGRNTKKTEDKAYCLLGIFGVFLPLMYGEGDNAFKRLKEEINKLSGEKNNSGKEKENQLTLIDTSTPAAPTHVHWMVTRPTNPLFTGREELLQDLDDIIRNAVKKPRDQTQCRIVISGMGGQGKSEICLQLAHRLRQTLVTLS
jgi:hypothetical protein